MARFDHLIIGTGIHALLAAAMLSHRGDSVLMIERKERIGGLSVASDDVTLPAYHHDVMAASFLMFLLAPAYRALREGLVEYGLELCHSPNPTAVLRPNGSSVVLSMDRKTNVLVFNQRAAGDGDRYAKDVGRMEADAGFLSALLGQPLWSRQTAILAAKQLWNKGFGPLKTWFQEDLESARGWLETRYGAADIQALWAPWVLHLGLSPEANYGGQMSRAIAFALETAGVPVIKGGTGQAVAAFRSLIEANGGKIRTGVEATQIIVEKGRAAGVETSNDEKILVKNVIVGTASGQLYEGLFEDKYPPEATKSYRQGRGCFQIHYALGGPIEWAAGEMKDVGLIHLADGIDSVSKSSKEAQRGMLPARPTICVGQPHRMDPSCCPEGKAVLWLQIPDAPRVIKGDAAGEIATVPEWSEAMCEAYADRIEGILKRHIKNWEAVNLKRRAYSPRDVETRNVNLDGGGPNSGACTLDQFLVWRPFAAQANTDMPVKNLYHIGAFALSGAGLSGASGFTIAKGLDA